VVAGGDDVRSADESSVHSAQSMRWKIKLNSNDELRQKFIDETVKQAEFIGLTFPIRSLKWNEVRGHYDIGTIDWNEFFEVIKGNGPCNRDRLRTRPPTRTRRSLGARSRERLLAKELHGSMQRPDRDPPAHPLRRE
jgi:hypothetical protein